METEDVVTITAAILVLYLRDVYTGDELMQHAIRAALEMRREAQRQVYSSPSASE